MAIILLLGYSDKFSKTGQYSRNIYWKSEWEEDRCTKRGKPEGNTPLGRTKRRREDTKMILSKYERRA